MLDKNNKLWEKNPDVRLVYNLLEDALMQRRRANDMEKICKLANIDSKYQTRLDTGTIGDVMDKLGYNLKSIMHLYNIKTRPAVPSFGGDTDLESLIRSIFGTEYHATEADSLLETFVSRYDPQL